MMSFRASWKLVLRGQILREATCKTWRQQWHYRRCCQFVSNTRCFHASATTPNSDLHSQSSVDTLTDIFNAPLHVPVMLEEAIGALQPQNGQVLIDMTFGAGGHTQAILREAPQSQIFALDRDPEAFALAQRFGAGNPNITPLLGRFSEIHKLLSDHNITDNGVDGVLFDVGASSMQFDQAERGFALSQDGPLDMRMDGTRDPEQLTAADVVNHLEEDSLHRIIKKYGEERMARLIARAIVDSRHAFGRITTTRQLANVVESVFEGGYKRDKLKRHSHVATKTFQALRIFVNNELNELYNGLEIVHKLLKPGGVCVAVTFHSLEDRIVKRHFHGIDMDAKLNMSVGDHYRNSAKTFSREEIDRLMKSRWKPFGKKGFVPTEQDIVVNPRARSAKMRVAVKL